MEDVLTVSYASREMRERERERERERAMIAGEENTQIYERQRQENCTEKRENKRKKKKKWKKNRKKERNERTPHIIQNIKMRNKVRVKSNKYTAI